MSEPRCGECGHLLDNIDAWCPQCCPMGNIPGTVDHANHMLNMATARAEAAEAEVLRMREKNTELNRRASKAEAALLEKHDALRSKGERTFGRVFANAAANAEAIRCERLEGALEAAIEVMEFAYMNALKQPKEIAQGRAALSDTAQPITKEWCLNMARLEGDAEIGAGKLAIDPETGGVDKPRTHVNRRAIDMD